jgi:hypothetical protein
MGKEAVQDKIARLEAQVETLKAIVAERDKTILKLQEAASKRKGTKSSDREAAPSRAWTAMSAAADVYLSHWCDTGLAPYSELVRVSLACRTLRKKALDCLRLMRRLDFR